MLNKILYAAFFSIVFTVNSAAQTNGREVVPQNLLPELLALNGDLATRQNPKYLSPTDMAASPDGKYIYIAEQQMKQVAQFDCATNQVVRTFLVPNEPTGVAVSKDGTTVYVTCASDRAPAGFVCVISTGTGKVIKRIPAGHYTRSPVLSLDGGTLYTCNWLGNDRTASPFNRRIAADRTGNGSAGGICFFTLTKFWELTQRKAVYRPTLCSGHV